MATRSGATMTTGTGRRLTGIGTGTVVTGPDIKSGSGGWYLDRIVSDKRNVFVLSRSRCESDADYLQC